MINFELLVNSYNIWSNDVLSTIRHDVWWVWEQSPQFLLRNFFAECFFLVDQSSSLFYQTFLKYKLLLITILNFLKM